MIEQFEAVSYKGLHNLCIEPLQRVNLITGPNGVGKTSLAEALWLFHGRYNPLLLWNLHVQRRPPSRPSPLEALGGPVELRGEEDGDNHSVRFNFQEFAQSSIRSDDGPPQQHNAIAAGSATGSPKEFDQARLHPGLGFLEVWYDSDTDRAWSYGSDVVLGVTGPGLLGAPPQFDRATGIIVNREAAYPVGLDTIERFSNVVAEGQKQRLLQILRLMQPRIHGLEILTNQGMPSLWADTETAGMLPLEAVGGGVVRLLSLLVNFFTARGGLIIVDEIENGVHHAVLPELWRQIRQLSELLDVQVVATTHSFECIQAAVMTGENGQAPNDFVIHRMYEKDGVRASHTYSGEKLMTVLDLGFEIR